MSDELLTPAEMGEADRLAIEAGPFDGYALMRRAGAAVAAEALQRFGAASGIHVLAGPGNNGGDGYVVAECLRRAGVDVSLWREAEPRPGGDAARAALDCTVDAQPLSAFRPEPGAAVIDALYGAGLSKPLGGTDAEAAVRVAEARARVLAVDLPSGVSGASGARLGPAFRAEATVTFFRKKPGHVLQPGRADCGTVAVVDIGIPASVLNTIRPQAWENLPSLWLAAFPSPAVDTHKYARGHVGVFSGGPAATGAARMSAAAAARAGAGAVTLLSPGNALQINAAHLTSTILHKADSLDEVTGWLAQRKPAALVFGPGLGTCDGMTDFALDLIAACNGIVRHIVFDADAITILGRRSEAFFAALRRPGAPGAVLTPHTGEFSRLFPDLADDAGLSKIERARTAASRANATIILKGPDTVIAAPDGRAAVNTNGTPWLATAGSGDVLAGIAAGLLSQAMPSFEACCAAVWLHAEAAGRFGAGLIAEDLPGLLPPLLAECLALKDACRR